MTTELTRMTYMNNVDVEQQKSAKLMNSLQNFTKISTPVKEEQATPQKSVDTIKVSEQAKQAYALQKAEKTSMFPTFPVAIANEAKAES